MKKANSAHVPDRLICFLYRELLLPWEDGLCKKQFPDFDAVGRVLPAELRIEPMKRADDMFRCQKDWERRKDQYLVVAKSSRNKAHTLINQLRNAFAHGDLSMCHRDKTRMIRVAHLYEKNLRLFGQLTESSLRQLIVAITAQAR